MLIVFPVSQLVALDRHHRPDAADCADRHLLFMYMFGGHINMITLMALVALRGLADRRRHRGARNIVRHVQMGKTAYSGMDWTQEIGLPAVLATTLSIVAVFHPDRLHGRHHQQVFPQFGITIIAAVPSLDVRELHAGPILSSVWRDPSIPCPWREGDAGHLLRQDIVARVTGWFDRTTDALSVLHQRPAALVVGAQAQDLAWRWAFSCSAWPWCHAGNRFVPKSGLLGNHAELQYPGGPSLEPPDEEPARSRPSCIRFPVRYTLTHHQHRQRRGQNVRQHLHHPAGGSPKAHAWTDAMSVVLRGLAIILGNTVTTWVCSMPWAGKSDRVFAPGARTTELERLTQRSWTRSGAPAW